MFTIFAIPLMASLGLGLILPTVGASRQGAPHQHAFADALADSGQSPSPTGAASIGALIG